MRVTYNELMTLTTKCFNSLNLPIGEVDRIANMVADLELVGYDGLKLFSEAMSDIQNGDVEISINTEDDNVFNVDLKNNSVLLHLPTLIYYARQKLLTEESITINIENARNRWFAYGELKNLSGRGFHVYAKWSSRGVDETIVYMIDALDNHPDLYVYEDKAPLLDTLEIYIGKTPYNAPVLSDKARHIRSSVLEVARKKSIIDGVEVDENVWNVLLTLSKNILVKNSIESEKFGAGGV